MADPDVRGVVTDWPIGAPDQGPVHHLRPVALHPVVEREAQAGAQGPDQVDIDALKAFMQNNVFLAIWLNVSLPSAL